MNKNILLIVLITVFLIGGIYYLSSNKNMEIENDLSSGVSESENVEFTGDKGEELFVNLNNQIEISVDRIEAKKVQFYNHKLASGKIVYFMVYKDELGIIRAAAASNDVCAGTGKGYQVEGENIVCNNCGKSYPAANIGVESGDCNPAPISSNLTVNNGNAVMNVSDLEAIAKFF